MPTANDNDLQTQCKSLLHRYHEAFDDCVQHFTGLQTFKPRSDDVVIASFMKSGTTLAQQMVYQTLVAAGRVPSDPSGTDFEDISTVVPFIEMGPASGVLQSVHPYSPRAWKSHSSVDMFSAFPSSTRYIYCVRNGLDVAPSMLDFTLDWILRGRVGGQRLREAFYPHWFVSKYLGVEVAHDGTYRRNEHWMGRWFEHVKGWMDAKEKNVFFFVYEDVVKDLRGTVRRVADFIGVEMTEEQVSRVAGKCERGAMVGDSRFNDVLVSRMMGWDEEGGVRVREENAPGFKHVQLPGYCLRMYREIFEQTFGFKEYKDLLDVLHSKSSRHVTGS